MQECGLIWKNSKGAWGTNEVEKFYKTFGIKPKRQCYYSDTHCKNHCNKDCVNFYMKPKYPEITKNIFTQIHEKDSITAWENLNIDKWSKSKCFGIPPTSHPLKWNTNTAIVAMIRYISMLELRSITYPTYMSLIFLQKYKKKRKLIPFLKK